jgi:phenylacetate-CoA oxygenase PaaJ subunit
MTVSLHLRPEPYLYSEWVPLRASGLAPGQIVTLELEHIDDVGLRWLSSAELSADADGVVDSDDAPSRRGSYLGTSRDGLLWSMAPDGVTDRSDRTAFMAQGRSYMHMVGQPGGDKLQPRLHTLRVREGSRVLAEGSFSQTRLGPGVRVQELSEGPLRGLAFHPAPGAAPARGAVLSLTGSGGGVENSWAPLLASHGIPVLSAATFAWPGRPELMQHIDLAYFEQAALWMRQHFGVQRIAVQGGSRGGELTLVLAAYRPDLFCGGVAMVPFHNVVAGFDHLRNVHEQPSWVLTGQPLPYADVRLTLTPPWTTDWISAQGRRKLREYGIAPPGGDAPAGASVLRFVPRARPAPETIDCPRCGSSNVERLSQYGSTPCKALYRCVACREPFDYFKPY